MPEPLGGVDEDTITFVRSLYKHTDIAAATREELAAEVGQADRLGSVHERLDMGPAIPPRCEALYVLTRHYRPDVIIETGVLHGLTSAYLLEAVCANGAGRLYSVDLPSDELPDGKDPGWAIPDDLRSRWSLTVGATQDVLDPLLEALDGAPGLFYHDSWHAYPTMRYEFDLALGHMESGIIAAHDVNRNPAFLELVRQTGSSMNVDQPFELGRDGRFGFVCVGDARRHIPGWVADDA